MWAGQDVLEARLPRLLLPVSRTSQWSDAEELVEPENGGTQISSQDYANRLMWNHSTQSYANRLM